MMVIVIIHCLPASEAARALRACLINSSCEHPANACASNSFSRYVREVCDRDPIAMA